MSNVTGGSGYGGYGNGSNSGYGGGNSDGRYESFNSKNYGNKPNDLGYGNNNGSNSNYGGLGVYGDYTSGKSTLDKYKTDKDKKP